MLRIERSKGYCLEVIKMTTERGKSFEHRILPIKVGGIKIKFNYHDRNQDVNILIKMANLNLLGNNLNSRKWRYYRIELKDQSLKRLERFVCI